VGAAAAAVMVMEEEDGMDLAGCTDLAEDCGGKKPQSDDGMYNTMVEINASREISAPLDRIWISCLT
jgi:hypothetical protein